MHLWALEAGRPVMILTAGDAAVGLIALSRVGSALLRLPGARRIIVAAYRFTARHRRRLGRFLPATVAVRRLPLGPDGLRSSPFG